MKHKARAERFCRVGSNNRAANGKNCAVFHTNLKFSVLIPATI